MDKAEAIERLEYLKAKAQIALEQEVPEWIAEDVLGTIEAYDMAIEALQDEIWKDEPCNECVFVKGSGWCDNCNGKPKGLDALPNSRKAEQTEPQTDVYDYKGNGKWERSE